MTTQTITLPREIVEQAIDALEQIAKQSTTTYKAGNGRSCGVQDGSGEMCYILPHEPYLEAESTAAKLRAAVIQKALAVDQSDDELPEQSATLTDEKVSLIAHNLDDGDWNDLRYRDCWHKGFHIGFREAEKEHGITGESK